MISTACSYVITSAVIFEYLFETTFMMIFIFSLFIDKNNRETKMKKNNKNIM